MQKILTLTICLIYSSKIFIGCKETKKPNKEAAYPFILQYISEKSHTAQYNEIKLAFNCYYEKAVSTQRRNYSIVDTVLGEKFYGLDSLIIFNRTMDSAIIFSITKLANYEKATGFQFYAMKIFAYKNSLGWRFYDGCGTAVYTEKKYTYLMAQDNQRLWFAFDGEWLLWNNKDVKENPNFIRHACNMWCGPCADNRDSLNLEIYYRDIKENTPPDSLYHCN